MARALVLTVGTGTRPDVNIVNPLVKTVRDSAPEFTVLVASSVSRKFAEQVVSQAGLAPGAPLSRLPASLPP